MEKQNFLITGRYASVTAAGQFVLIQPYLVLRFPFDFSLLRLKVYAQVETVAGVVRKPTTILSVFGTAATAIHHRFPDWTLNGGVTDTSQYVWAASDNSYKAEGLWHADDTWLVNGIDYAAGFTVQVWDTFLVTDNLLIHWELEFLRHVVNVL